MQHLSVYYVAKLDKPRAWFVSGVIRNAGHIAIERCLDKSQTIFEFFIAPAFEADFVEIAEYLMSTGHFLSYEKKPNRFLEKQAE